MSSPLSFTISCSLIFSSLPLFFLTSNAQNDFTLKRTASGKDNFDHFKVPQSNCTDSGSHCKHFHQNAFATLKSCTCSCPYSASTFGFIGNSVWGCMENKKIRSQAGCSLRFPHEIDTYPFKVIKLSNHIDQTFVVLKGSKCDIDYASSRYLTCSGSWAHLDSSVNHNQMIVSFKENIGNGNYRYYIALFGPPSPLSGLFLSLSFKCPGSKHPSCILFKISGQMTCNAGGWQPPTITIPITNSPATDVTPGQGLTTQELPKKSNRQEKSSEDNSSGVIAAVVAIILLGLLVVIIVVYIYWKKRRGESVWILDRCLYFVGKIKPPKSQSPKERNQECSHYYNDDNIYAEIPEVPRFTFVEGRITTSERGPHSTYNSSIQQGPEQQMSLRQGGKSPTDEMGYAVPVEFDDSNWNKDTTLPKHGTLGHVRDSESYTIPESDFKIYNENNERPFMVSRRGTSYHFAADDEYAEPNADLNEYDVLEEGDISIDNHNSLTANADLDLDGTTNNANDRTESYLPEEEERMTRVSEKEEGVRKNASFSDDSLPDSANVGETEQDYDIPEIDLSGTNTMSWPSRQTRSTPGDNKRESSQSANNTSTNLGERAGATINPSIKLLNKKTRRRPPSPPRAPNNSNSHYV